MKQDEVVIWAHQTDLFHSRPKNFFPLFLRVHMVYEHPQTYHQLISNKKLLKSLHRKKLHSYFLSRPGFEPMHLQNDTCLRTCALAYAATQLSTKFSNSNECDSEEFLQSNFKPLAQERTSSQAKTIELYLQFFIGTITYLRGNARKCTYTMLRPRQNCYY